MSETPIYTGLAGSPVSPPPPANPREQDNMEERINALIESRLSAAEEKHNAQIKALEAQLAQARGRPGDTTIPFNAGGDGTEIAQTWSAYHQDLANRGELTDAHLAVAYGRDPEDA